MNEQGTVTISLDNYEELNNAFKALKELKDKKGIVFFYDYDYNTKVVTRDRAIIEIAEKRQELIDRIQSQNTKYRDWIESNGGHKWLMGN